MRTIAHLSDLHFGRIDPPVVDGLLADLRDRHPSVLVVSGDFTQRARPGQYLQAAEFLRKLPGPQIVVPGNHDVPLYDAFRRFFRPLHRYRKFITENLFPEYIDEELMVLGVSTARSFTRTSGWMSPMQFHHVRQRICAAPPSVFKVLVTHHPFIPPPRNPNADVLLGGAKALAQLEECGVDMLLAGHLHLAYHDDVRAHHTSARRSVLSIQAGTATSTRRRGEPNAYNWITVSPDLVTVAVRAWNGNQFEESLVTRYERTEHVWQRIAQVPVDHAAAQVLGAPEGEDVVQQLSQ
ncbi:MAG TPA: metallophosphoesterase [Tepidisphaeraceae bacterium]|nr:metallophosphoesterase [Tepidisphaeraceae bacterium]